MTDGTPEAEVDIHDTLVRGLLRDQHADLADLPLTFLDRGWDNTLYRLGKDYIVRLPRRQVAAQLIENEQRWLPELAARLPIAIPAPVRIGRPALGFPWCWSIVAWFGGETADLAEPAPSEALALSSLLKALHQAAPPDAPVNDVRGVPIADRAAPFLERVERLRPKTDLLTDAVMTVWEDARSAPDFTDARWLHGDLHARNVLVQDGKITGIIDWGDTTSGDVATDLASLWMLFDDAAFRQEALAHYDPTADEVRRAKGWAVMFGVVLLDTGLVDFPAHVPMGEKTLRNVASDL